MPILALAARHHEVGLENLERLSARPDAVRRAVVARCPGVRGAVVLATCNRFELYLDVARPDGAEREVLRAVASVLGTSSEATAETLTRVLDPAAHVCAVAAGLDSMVLGEREVAGQVRRAISQARADGSTTGALERLFASASIAARRVANETGLGALGRSVVDVALDAAGVRPGARCVLVGTGSYAGAAAAALVRRGASRIDVFSATGRAAQFADARGLGTVAPGALAVAVAEADVVVTCSGGPDIVLGLEHFAGPEHVAAPNLLASPDHVAASDHGAAPDHVAGPRPARDPIVVVDLALRRDVDPAIGELAHVRLLSLRELAGLAHDLGADDLAKARAITVEVAADLARADRAIAWGRDLAAVRRRALAALAPHARREVHARLHPASALASAAARAGDRQRFEAALVAVAMAGERPPRPHSGELVGVRDSLRP